MFSYRRLCCCCCQLLIVVFFVLLSLAIGFIELAKERAGLVASWEEACKRDKYQYRESIYNKNFLT